MATQKLTDSTTIARERRHSPSPHTQDGLRRDKPPALTKSPVVNPDYPVKAFTPVASTRSVSAQRVRDRALSQSPSSSPLLPQSSPVSSLPISLESSSS